MSLSVSTSSLVPSPETFDRWLTVGEVHLELPKDKCLENGNTRLEQAFDDVRLQWQELAETHFRRSKNASNAHTPSLASNVSDFGLMLAWRKLALEISGEAQSTILVCDDPWLFRCITGLPGVDAVSPPPSLSWPKIRSECRGFLSRCRVSLRVAWACMRLRKHRHRVPSGAPWIIAYGHPGSTPEGVDAYFGEWMLREASIWRVLHTDCNVERAITLTGARSVSLHAWGRLRDVVSLPFKTWKVPTSNLSEDLAWLVRRAVTLEGATGQSASIAWQRLCQSEWLKSVRPTIVHWPWENHGWEREFIASRKGETPELVGYVHVPVYWREWNYIALEGSALPDKIYTCGASATQMLERYGHDWQRLQTAGAWRFDNRIKTAFDTNAPVFVALPADHVIGREMVEAMRAISENGRCVLIRDHPMTPLNFEETMNLKRAQGPLGQLTHVSAVVYASTTVGLEARLAGLPTYRFLPTSRVGQELPPPLNSDVCDVNAETLLNVLKKTKPLSTLSMDDVFARIDPAIWRRGIISDSSKFKTPKSSVLDKFKQLIGDPVLRRWVLAKLRGAEFIESNFKQHRPNYLSNSVPRVLKSYDLSQDRLSHTVPDGVLDIQLLGKTIRVSSESIGEIFDKQFDDLEVFLALHRFAWIDGLSDIQRVSWLPEIWAAWVYRFESVEDDWIWHPYTSAERAINIMDWIDRDGSPYDPARIAALLIRHADSILMRLEYFGETNTSNHLANNGRGLHAIGLWLGMPEYADLGAQILIEEAERIFMPEGTLREGSTHYHALLTRNYGDAERRARSAGRAEAEALKQIHQRAKDALNGLMLPGGLPLFGDISPDKMPDVVLNDLSIDAPAVDVGYRSIVSRDRWIRARAENWSALTYVSPDGWPLMPGHAHHDFASVEVHLGNVPLIVDPGRGRYGEEGDASYYRSGEVHNGLRIDGLDQFPRNKPYYSQRFRDSIKSPPSIHIDKTSFAISTVGDVATRRTLSFMSNRCDIVDQIFGSGTYAVSVNLCIPHHVEQRDGRFLVYRGHKPIASIETDGFISSAPSRSVRWYAYGRSSPTTFLGFRADATLPWEGRITIRKI